MQSMVTSSTSLQRRTSFNSESFSPTSKCRCLPNSSVLTHPPKSESSSSDARNSCALTKSGRKTLVNSMRCVNRVRERWTRQSGEGGEWTLGYDRENGGDFVGGAESSLLIDDNWAVSGVEALRSRVDD